MQNVGLVLSGGGHKSAAHLGVIKALEEHHINPTHIVGVSAGAIIGALYAHGYSVCEMLFFLKNTSFFKFSNFAIKKPGILDTDKFKRLLNQSLPHNSFEKLSKSLTVVSTDLIHAKEHTFNQGELITPLLASAAYPGIFSPVVYQQHIYADGGILNNFPIEYLPKNCTIKIGSHVSPIKRVQPKDFKYSVNVMNRALDLTTYYSDAKKFRYCDIMINPPELSKYGIFESNEIDNIFNIGYQAAKKAITKNQTQTND